MAPKFVLADSSIVNLGKDKKKKLMYLKSQVLLVGPHGKNSIILVLNYLPYPSAMCCVSVPRGTIR